jgi:1,4-alpha-glucan branching enzyme
MSIKKRYVKDGAVCKVTFDIPQELTVTANKVTVVGEFNNWDKNATPMYPVKDKVYKVTLDLETGREYQFRYLIDEKNWVNDWHADKYVSSPIGNCENSVVVV